MDRKLMKDRTRGMYWGADGCQIVRTVRNESNDHGRAGSVYWMVYDSRGNVIGTAESLWDARSRHGIRMDR